MKSKVTVDGKEMPPEIAAAMIVQASLNAIVERLDQLILLAAAPETTSSEPVRDEAGRIVAMDTERKRQVKVTKRA